MNPALAATLILGAGALCGYIAYYTGWQRGHDRATASHRVECGMCATGSRLRHPTALGPRPHVTGQDAVDQWLDENYRRQR